MKIITPRGTFTVAAEFTSDSEARQSGYGYYFTNDDGTHIYTKHIDEYHCTFGIRK